MLAAPPKSHRIRRTGTGTELPRTDGRALASRRFRQLCEAYEAEIGAPLTEVERGLVKQAAALTLQAETMQTAIINGELIDADQLIRITGTARRILESIAARAAKNRPADGASDLQNYLASRQPADDADAVNDEASAES
jgi:hypothetical protein